MAEGQATTAGIAAARSGALQTLQFSPRGSRFEPGVRDAAIEISVYHAPKGDQAGRHSLLSKALEDFLIAIVDFTNPGPERSTAISRAREAKMWASAAVALEGV